MIKTPPLVQERLYNPVQISCMEILDAFRTLEGNQSIAFLRYMLVMGLLGCIRDESCILLAMIRQVCVFASLWTKGTKMSCHVCLPLSFPGSGRCNELHTVTEMQPLCLSSASREFTAQLPCFLATLPAIHYAQCRNLPALKHCSQILFSALTIDDCQHQPDELTTVSRVYLASKVNCTFAVLYSDNASWSTITLRHARSVTQQLQLCNASRLHYVIIQLTYFNTRENPVAASILALQRN